MDADGELADCSHDPVAQRPVGQRRNRCSQAAEQIGLAEQPIATTIAADYVSQPNCAGQPGPLAASFGDSIRVSVVQVC